MKKYVLYSSKSRKTIINTRKTKRGFENGAVYL